MANISGNATASSDCNDLPEWGLGVGVAMSVAGSIGINVGQNLQASGIEKLPLELRDLLPLRRDHRAHLLRVRGRVVLRAPQTIAGHDGAGGGSCNGALRPAEGRFNTHSEPRDLRGGLLLSRLPS